MDAGLFLLLAAPLILELVGAQDTCSKVDTCTCKFNDGSEISLKALALNNGQPKFNFIQSTPPGAYEYAYNPCDPFTYQNPCVNVAACQKNTAGTEIFNIGSVNSATFNPTGTKITYSAADGSTTRTTNVNLTCKKDAATPVFSVSNPGTGSDYQFQLTSCHACRGGCHSHLSGGSVLCILFSVLVVLYLVVGVLFLKFVRGAEGKELIPNYEFWKDLPFLIKDGVLFVSRGFKAEPDNYEQI